MLKLKKEDYEKILDHCRKGLPNESCGLLGGTIEGDVKTIEKVYLLTNIDESNEHFSMDPKEQRDQRYPPERISDDRKLSFSSGVSVKAFRRRQTTCF